MFQKFVPCLHPWGLNRTVYWKKALSNFKQVGEIMKLLLAKMLMGRYNILLMDEPSNFLDIPSLEALEILMKEYAGTIMFITHDKRLLEMWLYVIYEIKDKKLNLVR